MADDTFDADGSGLDYVVRGAISQNKARMIMLAALGPKFEDLGFDDLMIEYSRHLKTQEEIGDTGEEVQEEVDVILEETKVTFTDEELRLLVSEALRSGSWPMAQQKLADMGIEVDGVSHLKGEALPGKSDHSSGDGAEDDSTTDTHSSERSYLRGVKNPDK